MQHPMISLRRIRCLAPALLLGIMLPVPVGAQVPVEADSAAVDAPDSVHATVDSLAVAAVDTLAESAADPLPPGESDGSWGAPWQPLPAQVDEAILDWTRPEDFEGAYDWIEGSSVRVAGETGMDAFVNTSPFSVAPELVIDGVPTRSPADLDPAIWDRGSNMVTGLATTDRRSAYSWGQSEIQGTLEQPLAGRTVFRSYFTRSAFDTYTRAIGVRTPGTRRIFHFDFQEFKTESGYQYSDSPAVTGDPSDRGRAKQRHFRIGGKVLTPVGELGLDFGRGRRYARGDVISADPHERWTGHLSLGFDRPGQTGDWHARLYHLDFHDDWMSSTNNSLQSSDASRLGLRVERTSRGAGFFGGVSFEQQSARFLPPSTAVGDTTYVTAWTSQVGGGWHGARDADWFPWISASAALAEHTTDLADWAGRAGVRRRLGTFSVQVLGERVLRTPTLAETYGTGFRRLVTPTADGFDYDLSQSTWDFTGAGPMGFERHDRAELRVFGDFGRFQAEAAWSSWWLDQGIGWEPTGAGQAGVVSGLETELDMVDASLRWTLIRGKWRVRALGRGHWLPGGIDLAGGRPAGFARAAALGRLGIDRSFFSPRNRIGVDVGVDFLGEHFDDLTAPIGGVVPGVVTLDCRAWLEIRDAEIYLAVDNVLDEERVEVLGTRRRFQQLRFGLKWDFYN